MRPPRLHPPAIIYFDAVRRPGPIREAARRFHVTSSAVNRQILKLEAELGAPLFDRLPGGVRLTVTGEIYARHIILGLQDAERASFDVNAGHVETAAVEGVCSDMLPTTILEGRTRLPN